MKNFLKDYWFAFILIIFGILAISSIFMDKPHKTIEYSYLSTLLRFTVGPAYSPCDYTIYADHHTETDCGKKEDVTTQTVASSTVYFYKTYFSLNDDCEIESLIDPEPLFLLGENVEVGESGKQKLMKDIPICKEFKRKQRESECKNVFSPGNDYKLYKFCKETNLIK